jgi:DNA-binding response OmpR family regulator
MPLARGPLSTLVLLLQVDDDQDRAALLDALEAAGAEVVAVADPVGAGMALRRYQFSAVILSCDPAAVEQQPLMAMIRSLELPLVIRASAEAAPIAGVTYRTVAPGDGVAGLIAALTGQERG